MIKKHALLTAVLAAMVVLSASHAGATGDPNASWDDRFWRSGANVNVHAIATIGTDVFVGGDLPSINNIVVNGIAKWDGSNWSSLGGGVDEDAGNGFGVGVVNALAVIGTDLYAAGEFQTAGGIPASNIAKWNGSSWSSLGSGVDGVIFSMAVVGTDLYIASRGSHAGGVETGPIAKWDGSSWSALGSGVFDTLHSSTVVLALSVIGSDLYVGGTFNMAGGNSANHVAKWDGSTWSALGDGVPDAVKSFAVIGTDLYASGYFHSVAKWDGSAWTTFGSINNDTNAMAVIGTDLYVGGNFDTIDGNAVNHIAKWDGSVWSALGSGVAPLAGAASVYALTVVGSDLYAGGQGSFTTSGGTASNLARWNGTDWSAIGELSGGLGAGADGDDIRALAVAGTNVYAGGDIASAGDIAPGNIVKWDGSAWSPLSTGTGVNRPVGALAVIGTDLYAGGGFHSIGGVSAENIAKWDGISWSALGSGLDGAVNAVAVIGTDLYVSGSFSVAGGVSASNIAKWDGSTWSALGDGIVGSDVDALAVIGTDLYAGGNFDTAGGISANGIAKWNGTSWSTLGSGVGGTVHALAVNGSDLYVGGGFSTAGAVHTRSIARWNGSAWSALGSGIGGNFSSVLALALQGNDLYVGGSFRAAGGKAAYQFTIWHPACGNGLTENGEQCDDGNTNDTDGCKNDCTLPPCASPPANLIGWWRGDGTSADIIGGHNATLQNGATYGAGQVGQAFQLDGSDDYVSVADSPVLNPGTGDFTVDLWVNLSSTSGEQALVEKWNPDNGDGWTFTYRGGLYFATNGADIQTSATVTPGTWSHVAARRSSGTFTLFLNGAAVGSFDNSNALTTTYPLVFGRRAGGQGFFLGGSIDEVQLFNRALSDAEIQSIAGLPSTGQCAPPPFCGNGLFEAGEACDDGNAVNGDGCDNDCSISCGNGVVSSPEACDDGNLIDGDGCDSNCTLTACGNGIVTSGETCEDGNNVNGDGCDNNCTATGCGNGIVTVGEFCDDGNGTNGDGCENNCRVTGCGDGTVAGMEQCDDGNATDGDGCDNNCTVSACGNGISAGSEACDDGNTTNGDGCDNNCTLTACGNGIATSGEACDDGNATNGDGCDNNCTATACGNAIVTSGEACDDGNATNGDGCDNNCTLTACGNGIATGGEACDDGNATNGDGCDNNCTVTACGNHIVTSGETCDDGNHTNGDGCDNNCKLTACGNGIRTGSEVCDDGNLTDGDGCDGNCKPTGCGNGRVTAGEICDDGNLFDGDGCDSNCVPSGCGNNAVSRGQRCEAASGTTCTDICNNDWANSLANGIDVTANAILMKGSDVYVGGDFDATDGGHSVGNRIAKWSNGTWSALGTGTDSSVYALAMVGTDLYAGGDFDHAGGITVHGIAKWNGTAWSALAGGTDNIVLSLFASGTDLYVGGRFDTVGGNDAGNVAKWNGSAWSALGDGVDSDVRAFAQIGSDIYVGGLFEYAGSVLVNHVAKWDGSSWSALGSGTPNDVEGLTVLGNDLYATGVGFVMKWDGANWSTLASLGNEEVLAAVTLGGNVYVAGTFESIGQTSAHHVARWDGSHWSALGSGTDNEVHGLATDGTRLFLAGAFENAGGLPAAWVASWRYSGCGEQCDDGNLTSGDGCDSNCTPTACGNGIVTAGEACDDKNTVNGDGCDSNCTLTGCGNGITTSGEACDDGNLTNGDGCESDCRITPIQATVGAGGTVGTQAASPSFPVQTEITTPSGGTIKIGPPSTPQTPAGYAVVGAQLEITAPDASPEMPLKIVMTVDASAIPPGYDASRLTVTRNGEAIDDCDNPAVDQAVPSPCIQKREVIGGNVKITVLTDHASLWSVVARGLYKDELKCVNGTAKSGLGVSKTQGKANAGCLKSFVKDGADPDSCVAAGGKVGASIGKLFKSATKCTTLPPFGFLGATTIGAAAQQSQLGLLKALFGSDLPNALSTDSTVASCQAAVLKNANNLFAVEAATFLACEKAGLAGKTSLIVSTADLNNCFAALTADAAGKIAKAAGKLGSALTDKCAGVNLATALPGSCSAATDVASCLTTRVDCNVCKMLVASSDLSQDCESFDNGSVDNSCN